MNRPKHAYNIIVFHNILGIRQFPSRHIGEFPAFHEATGEAFYACLPITNTFLKGIHALEADRIERICSYGQDIKKHSSLRV